MLRLLIRFLGVLLLAGGFVALIVDGTRSLAGGGVYVTTLAAALQETGIPHAPAVVLDLLLLIPVSIALCGFGSLFVLLSHKHRATIGYLSE